MDDLIRRATCILLCTSFVGASLTGAAVADRSYTAEQGWLQLQQDQRSARQPAGPMTPLETNRLQTREQLENMRFRQTLEDQRQERDVLERSRGQPSAMHSSPGQDNIKAFELQMQQGKDLDALRLQMDMQRMIEGTPPGR